MRKSLLIPAFALGWGTQLMAQAPSSLSYPTPNVFIANVSNVFLSPNLSGNATGYTITPSTLPQGLSFNTNTGVISGVPTAASPQTSYTITANGAGGSASTNVNIQVTNNYFDNNYSTLNFGGSGVTVINGTNGDTISSTTSTTVGRNVGDVVLYRNIATLSGQSIDCIVKTVSVTSGTSFSAYDQAAASGGGNFSNNDPRFFSPQVTFPAGTASGGGGSMEFNFQFILGGTYNTATKSGLNVTLQNVKINTYDIDGNNSDYSNQYNEFGGFSTSEVGSGTSLQPPVYNNTTGLTTYRSGTKNNVTDALADATRVRLTYNNMSDFSIRMGGGGTAYFFLDFSSGPAFSTAASTTVPSIDLNTNVVGVNNTASGCGTSLRFTNDTSSNVGVGPTGALTQLRISFPTGEIVDGASERILVNGASNGTIALNSNPSISNLSLGGANYSVAGSTANNVRTLVFTKTNGSFTYTDAEALLDALRYDNNAAQPTAGSRNFTVNLRNASFQSPNAVFTATLNCVSISGNVFHDANGMTDNLVNANGPIQFGAGQVYVVRVNPSNNEVIDTRPIQAGGSYNFGTVAPGSYALYVSTSNPAAGTSFTAANLPTGYIATGEHLGADAGTDLLADGKLLITVGSVSAGEANFGLQIPPVTTDNILNNIANPGGFNNYTIPANGFAVSDDDGVIDSIVINSFPTGANYLKIGNTVYTTSGSTCPPLVSACTPWPGTVVVPFSGNNPIPDVSVDPLQEGNTSVVINFSAWDNGRAQSSGSSNLTLNFTGNSYYSLSGKVWNDANGNGLRNGSEALTAAASAGQTLYALLIQENNTYAAVPTVLDAVAVSPASGYTFANVPEGNNYTIRIVSREAAPGKGTAASSVLPNLATGWTAVSTNAGGTIVTGLNTNNPSIVLNSLSGNKPDLDFGIERMPEAAGASATVLYPSAGTRYTLSGAEGNPPVPSATDAEDGILGTGATIVITTLPQHTTLLYNNSPVTLNQAITNFNPALLQILVTPATVGQTGTSFQFTYRDAAGVPDPTPATYSLSWGSPLPIAMGAFTAAADGSKAKLSWVTLSEELNKGFDIERSADGRNWKQIAYVPSAAPGGHSSESLEYTAYDEQPLAGINYYRLKQSDLDGRFTYTEIRQVTFGKDNVIGVYPNPVSDVVYVKVNDWAKVAQVSLVDISGKTVYRTDNAAAGIDMRGRARGTYFLQVMQRNGETIVFKLDKR